MKEIICIAGNLHQMQEMILLLEQKWWKKLPKNPLHERLMETQQTKQM